MKIDRRREESWLIDFGSRRGMYRVDLDVSAYLTPEEYQRYLDGGSQFAVQLPEMLPVPDADLAGGRDREFRVTGGMSGRGMHEVCELAEEGLRVKLGGLLRWQALAIVAILHHPFED